MRRARRSSSAPRHEESGQLLAIDDVSPHELKSCRTSQQRGREDDEAFKEQYDYIAYEKDHCRATVRGQEKLARLQMTSKTCSAGSCDEVR